MNRPKTTRIRKDLIFKIFGLISVSTGALVSLWFTVEDPEQGDALAAGVGSAVGIFLGLSCCYLVFSWISGSLRFGVRSAMVLSRTLGIADLEPEARELMAARGLRTQFSIQFQPERGWRSAVFRYCEHSFLVIFTLAALIAASATGLGTIEAFSEGYASDMVIATLGFSCLAYLGFRGLSGFERPHLAKAAVAAAQAAAEGRAADSVQERVGGPINLGDTGRVVFGATEEERTVLQLRVPIWRDAVEIGLIERRTLPLEADDIDQGFARFDRATVFLPGDRGETLPEAWLTPEIRILLLVLFAQGGRVEAGEMVLRISLFRGFDRISAALPFLGALSALIAEQRALSEGERVHQALLRRDAAQRGLLLSCLDRLDDPGEVEGIRRRWARTGQGETRLLAAAHLMIDERASCLSTIAQDADAAPALRGVAMGRLVHCGDEDSAWVRARLATIAADDSASGVAIILGLADEYEAYLADGGERVSGLVEPTLRLQGVTGAALGYLLAVNGLYVDDAPVHRIRDAVLAPLQSLSTESAADLPMWALYGDVLDKLLNAVLPEPLSHEVPAARAEVESLIKSLATSRQGGLSMAIAGGGGALTLAEPDENALTEDS